MQMTHQEKLKWCGLFIWLKKRIKLSTDIFPITLDCLIVRVIIALLRWFGLRSDRLSKIKFQCYQAKCDRKFHPGKRKIYENKSQLITEVCGWKSCGWISWGIQKKGLCRPENALNCRSVLSISLKESKPLFDSKTISCELSSSFQLYRKIWIRFFRCLTIRDVLHRTVNFTLPRHLVITKLN